MDNRNQANNRQKKAKKEEPQLTPEEQRAAEEKWWQEVVQRINYSDKYSDDFYEYRHVSLPRELAQAIPKDYWDPKQETPVLRLLSEDEWRAIGITQSLGWEHYEVHVPEPLILLFRRPKDYIAPTVGQQIRRK